MNALQIFELLWLSQHISLVLFLYPLWYFFMLKTPVYSANLLLLEEMRAYLSIFQINQNGTKLKLSSGNMGIGTVTLPDYEVILTKQ